MKVQPSNLLKEKVNKPLHSIGIDEEYLFGLVKPIVCF